MKKVETNHKNLKVCHRCGRNKFKKWQKKFCTKRCFRKHRSVYQIEWAKNHKETQRVIQRKYRNTEKWKMAHARAMKKYRIYYPIPAVAKRDPILLEYFSLHWRPLLQGWFFRKHTRAICRRWEKAFGQPMKYCALHKIK